MSLLLPQILITIILQSMKSANVLYDLLIYAHEGDNHDFKIIKGRLFDNRCCVRQHGHLNSFLPQTNRRLPLEALLISESV